MEIDHKDLPQGDRSNMRQIILDFPRQFRHGLKSADGIGSQYTAYNTQHTIIAGMGGSALPGELLKLFNAHLGWGIHVNIHRNYGLPWMAKSSSFYGKPPKPLIVCISYSGNTEETISAYKEARQAQLPIVAITTGGELARLAKTDKIPAALIPDTGIQPRAAIGYLVAATLEVLSNAGLIKNQDKELLALEKTLHPLTLEKTGKTLAKRIKDKTPLIYTSQSYKALAYIWKIKFNETGKSHAFWNYFPELNHNEMVGYTNERFKDNFFTIILRADDDHPRIKERMDLLTGIIKKRGYITETIDISGAKIYNKVFNTILLADWASYYLALEYGVDPTPVDIVEEFKKLL